MFFLIGRNASSNVQVDNHRDGKNATIIDSVIVLGQNFDGADYVFPGLGVRVEVQDGFSMHGPFKVLEHGVGHIKPLSADGPTPDRMALAFYSHSDVFEGVARHAATNSQGSFFSHSDYWLPFFAPDFDVKACCDRLMVEEKRLAKEFVSIEAPL